jgi:predicted transposase YbfD/YdcC
LAQLCVPEKTNKITAFSDVLEQLAEAGQLAGALVASDAMETQVEITDKILAHMTDHLLPRKSLPPRRRGDRPTLDASTKSR